MNNGFCLFDAEDQTFPVFIFDLLGSTIGFQPDYPSASVDDLISGAPHHRVHRRFHHSFHVQWVKKYHRAARQGRCVN